MSLLKHLLTAAHCEHMLRVNAPNAEQQAQLVEHL